MRILLIAYEFPPSPSPQSLRWLYLTRELTRLGYQVHVLTVDLPMQTSGLPALPTTTTVHRAPGGPIPALVGMLARRQAAKRAGTESAVLAENAASTAGLVAADPMLAELTLPAVHLNWKGRVMGVVIAAASRIFALRPLFPDARGAWFRPACKTASDLVEEIRPDLVVTSHEPATTLELGLLLKQRFGLPWIADLGDPVLADYTPQRWRSRSHKLERKVLANADGVTVTSVGTRELLLKRHGHLVRGFIEVLTQGFDDSDGVTSKPPVGFFDGERLELLYTGSFYRFRRPELLFEAVAKVPQVRLNLATIAIPAWLEPALGSISGQVRLLGFLPHTAALALQRHADVLINIANDNSYQVPGKVYEYLGSGRPILHIGNGVADDAAAELVMERHRGWVCGNDAEEIARLLRRLYNSKRDAGEFSEVDLGRGTVAEFGWSRLARRFADMATGMVPTNRTDWG